MKKQLVSLLPDALMVAGAGAVSYGAWAIYAPSGYLVAGALLLVAGVVTAKQAGE
jgi:hypothetical protein